MVSSNIIQLALALQRRRERETDRAAYASSHASWRSRYPEGIDGLWRDLQARRSTAEVVRFDRARIRTARQVRPQ